MTSLQLIHKADPNTFPSVLSSPILKIITNPYQACGFAKWIIDESCFVDVDPLGRSTITAGSDHNCHTRDVRTSVRPSPIFETKQI